MQTVIKPQVWRYAHDLREQPCALSRAFQAGQSLRFIEDHAKTQAEYVNAVDLCHPLSADIRTASAKAFIARMADAREISKGKRIRAAGRIYRTANRARIKGK